MFDDASLGALIARFPDRAAFGWRAVVGGLATLAISVFVIVVNVRAATGIDGDAIAKVVLVLASLLCGAWISLRGVRDLRDAPEWRIHERGLTRLTRGVVRTTLPFRGVPQPVIVVLRRHTGHRVYFGDARLYVPSLEVAQKIVELWRTANGLGA
jgi:hypothetical protein